jgi:hypothetical protein
MRDAIERRGRTSRCGVLVVVALCASAAHAQNLLPYPHFDAASDLTDGWSNLSAAESWTSLDVNDDPGSGSVAIENTSTTAGAGIGIFSVCVDVVLGQTYAFSAWQFTPSPPQAPGSARLLMQWRQSCPSGAFTGGDVIVDSPAEGAWAQVAGEAQAPLGAGGARLWVSVVKTTTTAKRTAFFDEAFVPEPGTAPASIAAVAVVAALRVRRRAQRR